MGNLRVATRKQAKIRLGLSAVSGGGKTYSALIIAKGLVGDWSKIAIIDTENGSADLYSHLGDYNVLTLTNTTLDGYVGAIKECENAGMECIIIDSITHFWGYCLELQVKQGSTYQSWAKVTPIYQSFLNAILKSSSHIITTVRRKQDYDMTKDANGKIKVEKAGLKEQVRDGFEYELTVNLSLDSSHYAIAEKDRTGLFMDKPTFIPTEETGKIIKEWCEQGIEVKSAEAEMLLAIENAKSRTEIDAIVDANKAIQPFKDEVKKQIRTKWDSLK